MAILIIKSIMVIMVISDYHDFNMYMIENI